MSAETMVEFWGPFAAENRIVMAFPQAKMCWDNMLKSTGENTYSREGP